MKKGDASLCTQCGSDDGQCIGGPGGGQHLDINDEEQRIRYICTVKGKTACMCVSRIRDEFDCSWKREDCIKRTPLSIMTWF